MPPAADAAQPDLEDRTGRALGSRLRLVIAPGIHRGGPTAEAPSDGSVIDAAWAAVLAAFAEVDGAMSRFRDDSEITALNRALLSREGPGRVSRRLRAALVASDRARRLTGGRFDPRVLRDMDRLGFAGVPIRAPHQAETERLPEGGVDVDGGVELARAQAVEISGQRVLDCEGGEVRLSAPVDLGGIGKGLALRWGADAAARILGGRGFLLDAGGDIATRGTAPATVPSPDRGAAAAAGWSIAIEDPLERDGAQPMATCALRGGLAIATSSTRIGRREAPGGPVHHLVDPGTGRPGGEGLLAVTVAWPDPAWAEVWSKSLFLAGAAAIAFEARGRGLAAWWVDAEGRLSMTPAARAVTTWVRDEARRGAPVSLP